MKRGARVLLERGLNLGVIFALVLQPISVAGVSGTFSLSKSVAVAADEEVVSEVMAVSDDKQGTELDSEKNETEKETEIKKNDEHSATEVVTSEPSLNDSDGMASAALVLGGELAEEAGEESVSNETDQVSAEPVPLTDFSATKTESVVETTEQEGPSIKMKDDSISIWEQNGKKATTRHKVILNEKYVAPQNDGVTVVFTKLPDDSGTLSIETVTLSDEQVALLGAFSHTAYEVTSSMENGTFAYTLTLPIPKGEKKDVRVKYTEDATDIEHAATVSDRYIEKNDTAVSVNLDHFTLFVATYGDVAFSVDKSSYMPGDTVYVKATGLNDSKFYKIFINPPVGSSFSIPNSSCFNPGDGVTTYSATYVLPGSATVSTHWAAELKEYGTSGCTGPTTFSDAFEVVATPVVQHVPITICHATPPDTAANGYESIQVDDDSVMGSAHATEHSADIIPAFVVGETHYPGQNWDAGGQAVWNNNCVATGSLKVVKIVDDGSSLSAWSFQLDNNAPITADTNGLVDFGAVPTGQHTITEIGLASYSIAEVSGANCTLLPEGAGALVRVVADSATVCTFSNAVKRGSITIVKNAVPNDVQDFSFTTTGTEISSFVLDDDGDNENGLSNTVSFSSLLPGQYSFTENAVSGWELSDMNCVASNVSLDMPANATADITLMPGENITCTYTNTKIVADPYCGDNMVNQESEECDGGVEGGQYSCSQDCHLVANPGTLHITKVVINDDGGTGRPEDFSYVLNEGEAAAFDSDGTSDLVLLPGSYGVTEEPALGYETSYSKGCEGQLQAGGDAYCVITNDDAPIEIVATKIVCESESDLPNYGLGGPDMTAVTASLWVATHPGCHIKRDWQFEWSYDGVPNPGDNTGVTSGDWHVFSGTTIVPLAGFEGDATRPVWLREVWDENYIPFTYGKNPEEPNNDNVTAEFYCHKDVVNYDNWDWIDRPVAGGTYYCVAWNVEKPAKIIVKKQTDPAGSDQIFSFSTNFSEGGFSLTDGEEYSRGSLTSGTYSVTELPMTGWRLESAFCSDGSKPNAIDLNPGETVTCTFKNQQVAHIVATKIVCESESDLPNYGLGGPDMTAITATDWVNTHEGCRFEEDWRFQWAYYSNDNPGDNTGESASPDWHTFGPTGVSGEASVDVDLKSSPLLWVREIWSDQYIPFTYGKNSEDPNSDDVSAEFYCHKDVVNYDNYDFMDASENASTYYCVAWNVKREKERVPRLQLRKFNNSIGDEVPGNEVAYTLEVTALEGAVDNVTVTDLPPEGFVYVPGSGEGAPFLHEYASPGIWDLGDMVAGETKTLTYKTKISDAQDAGLYRDLAFARGSADTETILANSVADPFVGTEVNVVLPNKQIVVIPEDNENKQVEKTQKKTQYVLGATTILPMTGASINTPLLSVLGIVIGLMLVYVSRRKKMMTPVLILLGIVILSPHTVQAAGLSVKIETPKLVVDSATQKIGFVTLDVLGRPLTVECYKNSDVSPFVSMVLPSSFGGNSGDCQIDSSVMPTDGLYEFYVKVRASGFGNETAESNHVSLTLASLLPGVPSHYQRSDASCQNVITFTTADDGGKTVKVELYRSFETTFIADAATKVDEQIIGSNTNGGFVEVAPGCSNDAYYAMRAVAVNGNDSGFVGDKDVNVDTHTIIKKKTTTVTLQEASASSGAIPVSQDRAVIEGQVEGVATVQESGKDNEDAILNQKSVLGDTTETPGEGDSLQDNLKARPWRLLFGIFIIGLVGYIGYHAYHNKHVQSE